MLVVLLVAATAVGGQGVAPVPGSASRDSLAAPGAAAAAPAAVGSTWTYPGAPGSDMDAGEVSLFGLLVKVGLGLSFVVGLAWGCVYLLKKSSLGQQFAPSTSGVRILERSFLAPKKAIYLVEIGDRALALGVTDESITVLSRWRAGELHLPERQGRAGGFASQFRSLLKRGDTP
ncbi:MAG: flagellar biosynthetic protein FliO [Gemmatimonadota bacterium]